MGIYSTWLKGKVHHTTAIGRLHEHAEGISYQQHASRDVIDLAKVSLSIPVGTASVEQSFSQMKMVKTRLRNGLGEQNLAYLMRIAIETPGKLPDDIVEIFGTENLRALDL